MEPRRVLHSFHSVSVEQLHVWDCCVITGKIVDRDTERFFVFLQKNRFRRTHSLTHYFLLLWVFHQVVFRSFVALWVVDRWTWAFLVYINVIFLFRWMNIQLKPTKIGLHLHWLCCRPGFLPPWLVFDLNLRPRWTRWILPCIMLMRYQHPVVACT